MNVCREICFQSRKSVTSKRFLFILTLENEEAEKILLKTMFRRSKAFMELGHHQRAKNKKTPVLYHETLPRIGQNFTESLRGGKVVKKRKIF